MLMSLNWAINRFETDDLSKIRLFFKRLYTGMGDYGSIDLFNWKIQENYVLTGIINLIKDDKEIVSTTSLTPKFLYFKGKKEIVNILRPWLVSGAPESPQTQSSSPPVL